MSHYSIKDLESLSGIKAHTLRIWEQRYHIIRPKRTETNIRLYDDEDLKKILNISVLNQNGYKISKIADMSFADITAAIIRLSQQVENFQDQIKALVISMMELDETRFERTIWHCVQQLGMEKAMVEIVYPFLNKVGLLWQIGTINPYQEHFVSNLIRQKLITAIDTQLGNPVSDPKKFLLFLPDGELHEIGLLFASYILKARGFRVYYLGQCLPFDELRNAYRLCKPDYTLTIVTSLGNGETQELIQNLSSVLLDCIHIVAGYQLVDVHLNLPNVLLMKNVQQFIQYVDKK